MSNVAIKDIQTLQSDLRRRVADGSWAIDVEELKQPKGLNANSGAEAMHMRVVIVRGRNLDELLNR